MRAAATAMLKLEHLAAGYGPAQVLFDVSLAVGEGEVVTLIGRNGMGKTTTIRVLMGLLPARGGAAHFDGRALIGLPPYRIAQAGLGLVPEGRQIFPTLTVEENLVATAAARFGPPRWRLRDVYAVLPGARRTAPPHGQRDFRRRAADAGDRPRPHDQSAGS